MEHFADALPLADYRDRARYRALRGRHGVQGSEEGVGHGVHPAGYP